MFRFKPEATEAEISAMAADLAGLAALVPSIRSYDFGPAVVGQEGNYDFAIVAGFDDLDGYREYAANEDHQRFIRDRIRPLIADRAAIQVGF